MHPEAYAWVQRHATGDAVTVLDIGGRNINGTICALFPSADYTALDIIPGPEVDIVADAATWKPDRAYDVVVCCEVFEHTDVWRDICRTAYRALKPGGLFVATAAGPGRAPHSALDGGPRLYDGEHYGNVEPDELDATLRRCRFKDITVDVAGADVRASARR